MKTIFVSVGVAVGALLMAGAAVSAPPPGSDEAVASKAQALLHDPHSQILGNPKGNVTIVEFFDYDCPVCKAIEPKIEDLLKTDKNVKLVIKEFPILSPQSLTATKVAFAADKQGKYAAFHQALMSYHGELTDQAIFETAKRVGLDQTRMHKDMEARYINDEIYANLNLARSLRMNTTPGIIIGNHISTAPNSVDIDFRKAVADTRASKVW
jgi:protein-disulfide isomerase